MFAEKSQGECAESGRLSFVVIKTRASLRVCREGVGPASRQRLASGCRSLVQQIGAKCGEQFSTLLQQARATHGWPWQRKQSTSEGRCCRMKRGSEYVRAYENVRCIDTASTALEKFRHDRSDHGVIPPFTAPSWPAIPTGAQPHRRHHHGLPWPVDVETEANVSMWAGMRGGWRGVGSIS
jgi:hypothetical protein